TRRPCPRARPPAGAPLPRCACPAHLRGRLGSPVIDHRPPITQREPSVTSFRGSVPLNRRWEHFDFTVEGNVATVTLNRPDKLNPLTFESYADLRDLLAELPHHDDVKVLVIQGEGKGCCGGVDGNESVREPTD